MKRLLAAVTALLVLSIPMAACGSDDSEDGESSGGGQATTAAEATTEVGKYLNDTGTFAAPPDQAPKPQPGKKIALVSCGQTVIPSCGLEINAAKEAAEAMGWTTTIIDAKGGDPLATVPGIQNAVEQKVDGIFTYYIDCKYIREPLQAAKDAGIVVVNSNGRDCSESDSGAPSLFTTSVQYNVGNGSFDEWATEFYKSQVDYAIDKLGGKANIGFVADNTTDASVAVADAVKAYVEECAECSIELLMVPITDIGTTLQGKVESFLLKNQDIDAVMPGYSAILTGGLMAGVESAGREILVSVAEGLPEGLALIRDGKAQYGSGISYGWEGYAAMDSMNRLLNGEDADVNSGIGVKLFDAENGMPSGEFWEPPFDYRQLYREAWGIDG
jgi:ribose transport system substrate-binding protein